MKLLKQVSRKYKGTSYHKHWVVISNELIEQLKWYEGDDLKAEVKNEKLIIHKEVINKK
jgi:antitoxin component of MazEF toxin-antitoxin module